jgi:hypothetical protein
MSVAEHLLDLGKNVELVTQYPSAGHRIGGLMWVRMMKDVAGKGARLTPLSIVVHVDGDTATVMDAFSGAQTRREGVDFVVIGDSVVDDALLRDLESGSPQFEVLPVGDCVAPRQLDMAILEGHRAGRAIN